MLDYGDDDRVKYNVQRASGFQTVLPFNLWLLGSGGPFRCSGGEPPCAAAWRHECHCPSRPNRPDEEHPHKREHWSHDRFSQPGCRPDGAQPGSTYESDVIQLNEIRVEGYSDEILALFVVCRLRGLQPHPRGLVPRLTARATSLANKDRRPCEEFLGRDPLSSSLNAASCIRLSFAYDEEGEEGAGPQSIIARR